MAVINRDLAKAEIISATPADFSALVALWKESVQATHHFLSARDFLELERDMPVKFLPAAGELWLYRHNGQLAGFCGNNGSHIEMLFVRPCFMRQGIGKKLLEHAATLHGPLSVEVNEQNAEALAFYRRLGFTAIGRTDRDGQNRPYPLLMLKQLSLKSEGGDICG